MDAVESGKKNFEDVLKAVYSEVNEIIRNSIRRGVRYPDLLIENVKT
jgi:hypothetical protein